MNDPRIVNESGDTPEEKLFGWLTSAFARLRARDEAQGAIRDSATVKVIESRGNMSPMVVEEYVFLLNDKNSRVEDISSEIIRRLREDAAVVEGAVYFVQVDGVESRWSISFPGPATRDRSTGAMVPVGPNGMSPYQQQGRPPFGGAPGPYGVPPGVPGMMGGPGMYDGNPVVGLVGAMVQDKQVQTQHTERVLELAIQSQAQIAQMTTTLIKEQNETIRSFEKDRKASMFALEDLYSKKHERDLATKKEERNEERIAQVFDRFLPMGMGAVARLFGQAAVPPELSPAFQMLMQAFSSITPQQLMQITQSGLLTPQQLEALMTALKTLGEIQERGDQVQAASQAANAGGPAASAALANIMGGMNGMNGAGHAP